MLWSAVADSSIDISNIVSVLSEKDHAIDPEKRDGAVKNLALQFHRYINNRKHYSHTHLTQVVLFLDIFNYPPLLKGGGDSRY